MKYIILFSIAAYLQKCKNDEHLNECFLKSAEAGIVNILKGKLQTL